MAGTSASQDPDDKAEPVGLESLLHSAMAHHRQGRTDLAAAGYRAVLRNDPDHPDALHLLGVLQHQAGETEAAKASIGRALARHPQDPLYLNSLGLVLAGQGNAAGAAACFERALAQRPNFDDAALNLAAALAATARGRESRKVLERLLARRPDHCRALSQMGELLLDDGDLAGARTCLENSLALEPDAPDAMSALALVHQAAGRLTAALDLLSRALRLRPRFAPAWCNLGGVCQDLGRADQAAECYRKALSLEPRMVAAWNNLGILAREANELDRAADCHRRALVLEPENAKALTRLAHLYQQTAAWDRLETILPSLSAVTRRQIAQDRKPDQDPFLNLALTDDPQANLAVARAWSLDVQRRAGDRIGASGAASRPRQNPIVVGYLSANFREHPNAQLVMGLFPRHDRRRFRIHGYCLGADDGSEYRRRIVAGCDRFVDLSGLDHEAAARRIRHDGVHILVDLMGHTKASRPGICARRPAPVQVRFLGFPASMGASFCDYFITDRWATPQGAERHFTERLVIMPHCYQANAYRDLPPVAPVGRIAAGLPESGFVFGCFNQPYKIGSAIFEAWMEILGRVPQSLLWLLAANPLFEANIRQNAAARGIAPGRMVFAPRLDKVEHLNRLAAMDLMLDTRPVCGHITATDALWAGVPVLALPGANFASRASTSYLMNLGLPDLVAADRDDYVRRAVRLASDRSAWRVLKNRLKHFREEGPLFDIDRYVGHLEAALEIIWLRCERGLAPAPITVGEDERR